MNETPPNQKSSWNNFMKDTTKQLQNIEQSDSIQLIVLPPKSTNNHIIKNQKQDNFSIFINRKKNRNQGNIINLEEKKTLINTNNPPPNKIAVPIVGYNQFKEKRKNDVINLEAPLTNPNIQIYRQRLFRKEERPIKVSSSVEVEEIKMPMKEPQSKPTKPMVQAHLGSSQGELKIVKPIQVGNSSIVRNSAKQIQKQIRQVDRMNEPVWKLQREQRRTINREKYPNSYTHSYNEVNEDYYGFSGFQRNRGFSGMGDSDKRHEQFLEKRRVIMQQRRKEAKEKKEEQERKRKEQEQKRREKDHANIVDYFSSMNPAKKKVKTTTEVVQVEGVVEVQNQLRQSVEVVEIQQVQQVQQTQQVQEVQEVQEVEKVQHVQGRQKRMGLCENVKDYQSQAPQFLKRILQHKFGDKLQFQSHRIPNIFATHFDYKKQFHHHIFIECICNIRKKIQQVEKNAPDPIKITVTRTNTNSQGLVEIYIKEKNTQEEKTFELKNLSLSRYRLGLLCSSRQYRHQYFGVSRRDRQFAVLVLLVTPQTKEELKGEVKALGVFSQSNFSMASQRKKELFFFDLEKLTTNIREYLAISNIVCSDLAQAIRNPILVQNQQGIFVYKRELLDDILKTLKDIFNQTQWLSIREMVLRRSGFLLLQGPPGTGKTSTLMGLLSAQYQYLRLVGDTRKIMICAPSNAAVDHIVRRICKEGLISGQGAFVSPKIVRCGIVQTSDPLVRGVSLDDLCQKDMMAEKEEEKKNLMTTAEVKEKIIKLQAQIRGKGVSKQNGELSAKKQELCQLQRRLFEFKTEKCINSRQKYSIFQTKHLNQAQIVLTTLASSGSDKMDKLRGEIACLIVDQAAQATQPNLLIALQTGVQKVILIGDPYQLPATCMSTDANVTLFNRSLLQRFLDADIKPYFLNIQYRMDPIIRQFPSKYFYQNRLIDGPQVLQREIPQYLERFRSRNVIFVDVAFGREQRRGDSYSNKAEAHMVSLLIRCLMSPNLSVGVITPYQGQRSQVMRHCMKALRSSEQQQRILSQQIMINTVDSFQGQQRDVILMSTVRANTSGSMGFLVDQRRINVTLTRAKYLCVVVGHGDTLGGNEVWGGFLDWCQQRKCYYQIGSKDRFDEVVELLLDKCNLEKVKRRRHEKLSGDVRKIYREEMKDQNCDRKREEVKEIKDCEKMERQKGEMQNIKETVLQNRQQIRQKGSKYALDIKESQQILQQKRKREQQAMQFERAQQRIRRFQQQNKQKLKNDPYYSLLYK